MLPLSKSIQRSRSGCSWSRQSFWVRFFLLFLTHLLKCCSAFYKSVDPGLVKINLCSESLERVSVRTQLANIKDQVAITKDNVTVRVDGVIYYVVQNPYKAAYAVEDMRNSVIERSQITLRSVLGSRNLQSLIQDREQISRAIEEIVTSITQEWG